MEMQTKKKKVGEQVGEEKRELVGGRREDVEIGGWKKDAKDFMFHEINVVEIVSLTSMKSIFVGENCVVQKLICQQQKYIFSMNQIVNDANGNQIE